MHGITNIVSAKSPISGAVIDSTTCTVSTIDSLSSNFSSAEVLQMKKPKKLVHGLQ